MDAANRLARKAHLLIDFLAVVEEGGVRQAAERIHLSQSALTRRIQELEERLGTALFERTARGMALTPAGDILLHHARNVVQSCADAAAETSDLLDGTRGALRIAVGTAWGAMVAPDAVTRLQRRMPGVQVTLLTHMADALARLADGHLDIVVGAAPLQYQELVEYEALLEVEQRVFAGRQHPVHALAQVGAADLVDHAWIWLGETLAMKPPLEQYFARHGLTAPAFAINTGSVQVAMRLLQHGEYLALLPSTLQGLATQSGLACVPLEAPLLRYSAGLMYRPGTARLRAFTVFRACLIDVVREMDTAPAPGATAASAPAS